MTTSVHGDSLKCQSLASAKLCYYEGCTIQATHTDPQVDNLQPALFADELFGVGPKLRNSLLSFDSEKSTDLNFLSSAQTFRNKNFSKAQQIITSEQTAALIEALGFPLKNTLVCQFNRPFSIGSLKLELLHAGDMLGAANLYVETKEHKIMYAASFLTESIATLKKMSYKKADYLLMSCFKQEPTSGQLHSRKKELPLLVKEALDALDAGDRPVILCNPILHGPEITHHLNQAKIPVAVHNSIFKINRAYESFGTDLGKYTFYSSRYSRNKAIIFPIANAHSLLSFRKPLPKGRLLLVHESSDIADEFIPDVLRPIEKSFNLNAQPSAQEYREIVQKISPKVLYLYGPHADKYQKLFESMKGIKVQKIDGGFAPSLFE